jgi:O-antigen ligase
MILSYSIFSDIFLLNDEYRGLDSGFSGRDIRWNAAINSWFDNYLFGIGFGESTNFLGYTIDNAYLSALLELGLFGFSLYISLIIFSLYLSFTRKSKFNLVFLLVYAIYGIFEKRYFSVGNPYSIMFIFVLILSASKKLEMKCLK